MHPPADLRAKVRQTIVPGALAGMIGGLAFGAAMIQLGVLPSVGSLVRTDDPLVGFAVHLSIAAIAGAGLGIVLRGPWPAGDTVFWGAAYGAFFWFLGPITFQPLVLERMPAWDVAAAQAAYPSLLGHVIWGATTGLVLVALKARMRDPGPVSQAEAGPPQPAEAAAPRLRWLVLRGSIAGLLAFGLIGLLPAGTDMMLSPWGSSEGAGAGPLVVAILASIVYAALHPRSTSGAGAAVVRGAAFGFLLWVIGGLTILPTLRGAGLAWTIDDARATFPALPGTILFGAAMAVIYHWLGRLVRLFFADDPGDRSPDGGAWGLRATVRGAVAGLVGGLVFTLVMLKIGFLPSVARLVGSDSLVVGLMVHLVIAEIIGISFGLLFRRQAFDPASAIGWGVSYGFLWWILGPLTLAPVILGVDPAWTAADAAAAFPSLIGHLAYGAALGFTFYILEARYSPWWITRSEAEGERMMQRRGEATSAGPAVWALLVLIAVLLPIVLSP